MTNNVIDFESVPNVKLLKAYNAFGDMPEKEIERILNLSELHHYEQDEHIFHEGKTATRFFFILNGYIRVNHRSEKGNEVGMYNMSEGELCGISKSLGQAQNLVTALAATKVRLLGWPIELWDHFQEDVPGFSDAVFQTLGTRWHQICDHFADISDRPVEARVAIALLHMADRIGETGANPDQVTVQLSPRDLAEISASSLRASRRVTSDWDASKIIDSTNESITINNMDALTKIAF